MMPFGSAGGLQKTRMLVAVKFWYITFRGAEGTARSLGMGGGDQGRRREREGGGRGGQRRRMGKRKKERERRRREGRGGEGKGEEEKSGKRKEGQEAIQSFSMSTSRTLYLDNNTTNAL